VKEDPSCSENDKGQNKECLYATVCISVICPHLGRCIWFETAQKKSKNWEVTEKDGKIGEAREQLFCDKNSNNLGHFSLETSRTQGSVKSWVTWRRWPFLMGSSNTKPWGHWLK